MTAATPARSLRDWFDDAVECEPDRRRRLIESLRDSDPDLAAQLIRLLDRDARQRDWKTVSAQGALERDDEQRHPSPTQAGAWTLREELGRGGMGRVLRAERIDGDLVQEVALKLLRRDLVDTTALRRFSTETQVLAALDHPGICRLVDSGELADGTPWVAMDRVCGEALLDHCDAQRSSLDARIALFLGVLDAVAHAHRNLVVHRDIKPGNVMVDRDGRVRLLDFGIAKRIAPDASRHTASADRVYTRAYAAPEQILGQPIGVACDVYGLGAMLYELLCGVAPFAAGALDPVGLERRILETPPPRMSDTVRERDVAIAAARRLRGPRELRRALRGDLDLIVQRCLRKAPSERYASVDLLTLDLRRVLDGHPISGRLDDRWYRVRKFLGRHRAVAAVSAASALLLGIALALIVQQAIESRRERDHAVRMLSFVQQTLFAVDPQEVRGRDLRVRDLLDAAQQRLVQSRVSDPRLFASMATTMGEIHLGLGDPRPALQLADAALLAYRETREEVPLATSLLQARALIASQRLAEADAVLQTLDARGLGQDVSVRGVHAMLRNRRGELGDAVADLQQLKDSLSDRPPGDASAEHARLLLAEARHRSGALQPALAEFDRTLAWQRDNPAPSPDTVAFTRMARAGVLRSQGRLDEALAEVQAARADVERAHDAQGTNYANALMIEVIFQSAAGRRRDAVDTARRAVAAWEASAGDRHERTRHARATLGRLLLADPATREEGERLIGRAES